MYEMVGMPTKALVFQLHGNTLDQLARYVQIHFPVWDLNFNNAKKPN